MGAVAAWLLTAEWGTGAGTAPAYIPEAITSIRQQIESPLTAQQVRAVDHASAITSLSGGQAVAELIAETNVLIVPAPNEAWFPRLVLVAARHLVDGGVPADARAKDLAGHASRGARCVLGDQAVRSSHRPPGVGEREEP